MSKSTRKAPDNKTSDQIFLAVGEGMHRVVQPKVMTPRLPADQKLVSNNMLPSVIKRRRDQFAAELVKKAENGELE